MLPPISRIQILRHTLHVLNLLILLWVPAIVSHQIKQYTSCKKNRFIFIPCPVLTLASDSLKTVKDRHVFHIWRHQEKVQGERTSVMASQWRSRLPVTFPVAAMRQNTTAFIRWFRQRWMDSGIKKMWNVLAFVTHRLSIEEIRYPLLPSTDTGMYPHLAVCG